MKIIFMGTPEFAVPTLESLIESNYEVLAVYTQPPRPAGRGQKERKSPVHIKAEEFGITVKTPKSLKDENAQKQLQGFGADVCVVAAYGLILPKSVLDMAHFINVHASLLPRWRGAAPIQRAILAGDEETGVTIMNMSEGLDEGDMLLSDKISIDHMSAGELHDALSKMGGGLIIKTLKALKSGKIKPEKQPDETIYAHKIDKMEAKIDWNDNVTKIERQIRAFNPFPGAYFEYQGEKIKILDADFTEEENDGKNGEVVGQNLAISCDSGLIIPRVIQRQGKKAMTTDDMLRGFKIPVGSIFS